MNNYAILDCVVDLYGNIVDDVIAQYPHLQTSLSRTSSRLQSIARDRGLSFFTITLPDSCHWFNKSLASGRLLEERPPYHRKVSKSSAQPVLLQGLYALVFDDSGSLRPDPDINAIFFIRQFYLAVKKLRLECTDDKVSDAILDFISIDQGIPGDLSSTWDHDDPNWTRNSGHPITGWSASLASGSQLPLLGEDLPVRDEFQWRQFFELCSRFSASLGTLDPWSIRPKHGPGVVSDTTSTKKYEFENYPEKLAKVFPADWHTSHDFVDRTMSTREVPSRLICVPKTQKGPRIIAAEPVAHQWIQGGIQRWLTDSIRGTFLSGSIDFQSQELSRQLALEASATGHLATVDLSAASDRLSCQLVQYVFQSNGSVLDALHASRTRLIDVDGYGTFRLRKFAAMGSACTFPVQTIVFALIAVHACMIADEDFDYTSANLRRLASNVRVFGDDIILPSNAYGILTELLEELGLKVNQSKSFSEGHFRESCGMDAYMGYDVTPAYFLQPYQVQKPSSLVSTITVSNNFHKKGMWKTADWILKTVEPQILKNLEVSNRDDVQPYIHSFSGPLIHTKIRWNEDYHRWERRLLLLKSKNKKVKGSGEASLFQYFTEEPDPMLPWESGLAGPPSHRLTRGWVALV